MKRVLWSGLWCLAFVSVVQADQTSAVATMAVKPVQTNVQPGGTLSVDVFISGAVNVAAYQVQVAVTGGDKGKFTLESMTIDRQRQDFALYNSGAEMLDVQDKNTGWIGLVRVSGGTDMVKPAYVATFTFKASDDAAGTFKVQIPVDNQDSFILDTAGLQIQHKVADAAQVSVGPPAPTRTESRKKG
jgi:hypothetical protein